MNAKYLDFFHERERAESRIERVSAYFRSAATQGPSNAESTFSMIKTEFGDRIRSKTDTAQTNEVLLKILCHNICVVIQSMYELGIEPTLWAKTQSTQKVP